MSHFPRDFERLSVAERLELVDRLWDSVATNETIDGLTRDDRITLAQDAWDSISDDEFSYPLTPELKAELDRRLAEHAANPHDCLTWEEVRAKIEREL